MAVIQLIFLLMFVPLVSATDLKDVTLQELVQARPDLVEAIEADKHEGYTTISVEKDEKGRRAKWTELRYDAADNLIGKRVDAYSYYPTGEVNTIRQQRFEGAKLAKDVKVKHYINNKQPSVTNVAIPIGEIPKL